MIRKVAASQLGSAVLAALAACVHASGSGSGSEIRLTRNEGYADVSSQVIIRSDGATVLKYFDPMQPGGDAIGVFRARLDARLFNRLWEKLEKSASVEGIKPDSRVLSVEGIKDGKSREYVIPLSPPIPEWAKSFQRVTDSLETATLAIPCRAITLAFTSVTGKLRQKGAVQVRNPGSQKAVLPGGSLIQLQAVAKPGPEGWPAGGPAWQTLAEIRVELDRDLPAGKGVELSKPFAFPSKGSWYFRASFRKRGEMAADSVRIYEEVLSAPDSVFIP